MGQLIHFGEIVEGYDVKVLNEREARAGAGILFLFAFISFTNALLLFNFVYTKVFVTVFMIDFFIRIFINPKFSPSLLLGRMMVQNQKPEYVSAPQKRFAWSFGFSLSIIMFFMIVIFEIMTPIKIVICLLCLSLLYFEAVFGICLGCILYRLITKKETQLCPGGTCEIRTKEKVQTFSLPQKAIIITFLLSVTTITFSLVSQQKTETASNDGQNPHQHHMKNTDSQTAPPKSHH